MVSTEIPDSDLWRSGSSVMASAFFRAQLGLLHRDERRSFEGMLQISTRVSDGQRNLRGTTADLCAYIAGTQFSPYGASPASPTVEYKR